MYGDNVRVKAIAASRETSQVDFEIIKGEEHECKKKETKKKPTKNKKH